MTRVDEAAEVFKRWEKLGNSDLELDLEEEEK